MVGQIDRVVDGEPALVAREDEQRPDEMLRVIDRGSVPRDPHSADRPRSSASTP